MPVVFAALLIIVAVVFAFVVLIPISLIQRYRVGTMRRRVRPWLVTINAVGIGISMAFFLASAALTNIWIPDAFAYAVAGAAFGAALGVAGLALTRWERAPGALFYTPNRWLVLAITLAVAGRIGYGFWRAYEQWRVLGEGILVAAPGTLAAGALVLGYYGVYWIGVRRRARRTPLLAT
jgi:hypothetical protein